MTSLDPLTFKDKKKYPDRVKSMQSKTGLKDAVRTAHGKLKGETVVIAAMDFKFIGGSMGSVVGEKIARAIDYAQREQTPNDYHLKIRWSKNDGSSNFFNAIS